MVKPAAVLVVVLLIMAAAGAQPIIPLLAKAQPQPPNVATLGPPIICSEGDDGTSPISTEFNYPLFTLPDFAQPPSPEPSISSHPLTILVPVAIATVTITCIGLLVCFKKCKREAVP